MYFKVTSQYVLREFNVLVNILKILIQVVDFFENVSEIQQLVLYSLQKTDWYLILHYISRPIYELQFRKICQIQKQ